MNESEWYKLADEMMKALADGVSHQVIKELVAEMWRTATESERAYLSRVMMETAVRMAERTLQRDVDSTVRRTLLGHESADAIDTEVAKAMKRTTENIVLNGHIQKQVELKVKYSIDKRIEDAVTSALRKREFTVDVGTLQVRMSEEDW